jgi:hypothetical protein
MKQWKEKELFLLILQQRLLETLHLCWNPISSPLLITFSVLLTSPQTTLIGERDGEERERNSAQIKPTILIIFYSDEKHYKEKEIFPNIWQKIRK